MSAPAASRGMGMNMVTTLMAFSVSAFFVLFVFTRLICARIQLRAAAAEHAAAAAAQASDAAFPAIHVERGGLRGMEPAVVTAFPTVKFGNDFQRPPAQEESQCTVCLEEYEAKDVVRVLPFCGHAFHVACIDAWLKQQSTCPICRASMRATAKHRAGSAVAMPPVYYAIAMARPSTSSSDGSNTLQGEAVSTLAPAAADHVEIVVADEPAPEDHVEIVVADEPVSSGAGAGASCPSRTPAPAAASGNPASTGTTSQGIFVLETEQSSQGNASQTRRIANADTYVVGS
ncbi:RING-H2 finger protein ATL80 [Brachypodium distachyon]|uniref:RING-type E3 ubiquitin transferase n=1 Tax=Brachypodium distachyon TaxID=15368 RepID=A0A0Q3FNF7_BRADI|nr:RING-H2 finger protein ATL80 [Brachypodium distachyon]KQJ99700.1 hypothetical protein BRADI_3g44733v3 [Brachypodium distachyon]|eukprot:XP_003572578.1 RING-H2 finger protein ATL80 [Brachypodium distachyon]